MPPSRPSSDCSGELAALRRKLAACAGQCYWRGLEELAGSPQFREFIANEFPASYSQKRTLSAVAVFSA